MRIQRLEAIAFYSEYFMSKSTELKAHAKIVAGKKQKADRDCFDASIDLEALVPSNLTELLVNYKREMEKCWNFTNQVQTTVLCDVCNSKLQGSMDFKSNQIFLNKDSCASVTDSCYYMTKLNVSVVYPYLKLLEVLSRCDKNGKIKDKIETLTFNSSSLLRMEQLPDDSKDLKDPICSKMVSFGSRTNVNSEGDGHYLKALFMRTNKMFKQKLKEFD